MTLITEAPGWLIILCVFAGIAYAGALYFKDRFNRNYGAPLATGLGVLRFISVTLIAMLLLRPMLRHFSYTEEKPIIVIAQDNSASLAASKDSTFLKENYPLLIQNFSDFGEDVQVDVITFGDTVSQLSGSMNFSEGQTDFSSLAEALETRYAGRNLGALIIASDGLYNRGTDPVSALSAVKAPIYTLALGDTIRKRDNIINDVSCNRIAYLGNRFPVKVQYACQKMQGETIRVKASHNGREVFNETITPDREIFIGSASFICDAEKEGVQKVRVEIERVQDEVTYLNNVFDVFIDVLDGREKILVLGSSPHPDMRALSDAINANENYECEIQLASDDDVKLEGYSMIIFHQLPSAGKFGMSFIENARALEIPSLFVWGNATDLQTFNSLQLGIQLNGYNGKTIDQYGAVSSEFNLFTCTEETRAMMSIVPPLTVPFGNLQLAAGSSVMIAARAGNMETREPLIAFTGNADKLTGIVCGEGMWRWRLASFQRSETHEPFNALIAGVVQLLTAKKDKSLFRVDSKRKFKEGENIIFRAELYNESYQPVTDREVNMVIKNENGEEFNYIFSPDASLYTLNAGQFPSGQYDYIATTFDGRNQLTERGQFSISAEIAEYINTTADHHILRLLAAQHDGARYYPSELDALKQALSARKDIVPVTYEEKHLDEFIDMWWWMLIIMLFLSAEWLLRKRAGTY